MLYRHFTQYAVTVHLAVARWRGMYHPFLHCSQHSPRRRVAVVGPVWPHSVVLTKPDPLTVVVTAAQCKLEMTRHFSWSLFSFAALLRLGPRSI